MASSWKSVGQILVKVVPVAFVIGGALELFMIKVQVGSESFYDTAKRLESTRRKEKEVKKRELELRVMERRKAEKEKAGTDAEAAKR